MKINIINTNKINDKIISFLMDKKLYGVKRISILATVKESFKECPELQNTIQIHSLDDLIAIHQDIVNPVLDVPLIDSLIEIQSPWIVVEVQFKIGVSVVFSAFYTVKGNKEEMIITRPLVIQSPSEGVLNHLEIDAPLEKMIYVTSVIGRVGRQYK